VPQSIIINEMLPKLRADPGYLDRLGYRSIGGKAVPSSSVNWFASTAGFRVRQPPSERQCAGRPEDPVPEQPCDLHARHAVEELLPADMRALSHGCVRLADPRKMAAAVLGTTVDDVKQIAARPERRRPRCRKIPVYVAYFTAWPNKDGKVEYFDDVYGRDMYMDRALEATRLARRAEG
jgi:murein L,D-transpeptidase YcbB/YkuD